MMIIFAARVGELVPMFDRDEAVVLGISKKGFLMGRLHSNNSLVEIHGADLEEGPPRWLRYPGEPEYAGRDADLAWARSQKM